ncbi:MAG TPA: septum formation initiator family protein [Candidatus Marinimicrobia bacterium]|nr:septum formation initiator family protein [Candidatus Neomarinimicrobiota bacterium]MDP7465338.1 septum formation initiator family protein [Candidatus Neomarinimicrobiota bacterium]HJM83718.1 septum formation initiator family protein [Candidatus Neomarinimicrobiota bacterium]|tara:strand:+ start:678 stop:998 length:321 start_codon:yes stop_codon:yes gene_type:complete
MLRKRVSTNKSIFPKRMMFFPLIFIIGGLFLISNDMGAIRWYQLRKERNQIRAEIDLYIQNEVELAQELDKLTNDAEYIKKIAQEKFHMVKPGEKVFRVIDRKKTN